MILLIKDKKSFKIFQGTLSRKHTKHFYNFKKNAGYEN